MGKRDCLVSVGNPAMTNQTYWSRLKDPWQHPNHSLPGSSCWNACIRHASSKLDEYLRGLQAKPFAIRFHVQAKGVSANQDPGQVDVKLNWMGLSVSCTGISTRVWTRCESFEVIDAKCRFKLTCVPDSTTREFTEAESNLADLVNEYEQYASE
jgi:hypothetical protein